MLLCASLRKAPHRFGSVSDFCARNRNVRSTAMSRHRRLDVSTSEMCRQETPAPQQPPFLIDHTPWLSPAKLGDRQVESLRRLEIDNQFVVSRKLNRQSAASRLRTDQLTSCASELVINLKTAKALDLTVPNFAGESHGGDRLEMAVAAVQESPVGTFRT